MCVGVLAFVASLGPFPVKVLTLWGPKPGPNEAEHHSCGSGSVVVQHNVLMGLAGVCVVVGVMKQHRGQKMGGQTDHLLCVCVCVPV